MRLNQVYTPQAVVNGRQQFVGSDRPTLKATIAAALAQPAVAAVRLNAHVDSTGHHINVLYALSHVPANSVLNLVAVERGLSTVVKGGENDGRTLRHVNVARAFIHLQIGPDSSHGHAALLLPKDANWKKTQVIGFVQDATTLHISGAAACEVIAATPG